MKISVDSWAETSGRVATMHIYLRHDKSSPNWVRYTFSGRFAGFIRVSPGLKVRGHFHYRQMDASQRIYLAQRTQSRKGMSYEDLGPDDVRRYTVDVYLVKNAKPLQWMLANTSLSEAFAYFFLSSEAEITEKTHLCDLAMGHRSH